MRWVMPSQAYSLRDMKALAGAAAPAAVVPHAILTLSPSDPFISKARCAAERSRHGTSVGMPNPSRIWMR